MSRSDVAAAFSSSLTQGLTTQEANRRLTTSGPNVVASREERWPRLLLRQFASPFTYLLIGAMAISLALGEMLDAAIILLFVAVNTTLGFVQEYRSAHTLKLLKQYLVPTARVRRDSREGLIPSPGLVPGDLVIVEAGDEVPADLRFIESHDLTMDESVLTGESAPAGKTGETLPIAANELSAAQNIGFTGTTVVSGKGAGIVIATGIETVFGRLARLAGETERVSTFAQGIRALSTFILRLTAVMLIAVFLAIVMVKRGTTPVAELALFTIALAVSVIPEALPLVTTFSLSRGALRLAKQKVVVKRLAAIEDLGGIEILCTDKTGTITENRLTVAEVYGGDPEETLRLAALAIDDLGERERDPNNAFDLAIWERLPPEAHSKIRALERLGELPFDPTRRRNSVLVRENGKSSLIVRGAAESILPACTALPPEEWRARERWITREGERGRRVIAVATRGGTFGARYAASDEERGLTFFGCLSFTDPLKLTTKQAVAAAERLGVRLKILTGDSREVAAAVGKEIGLIVSRRDVLTGAELAAIPEGARSAAAERTAVFARVSPEQKFAIVKLLEEHHRVGFLGEGINDAPALKAANTALVVQDAADIAREAADIVLLERSLSVVVDGIMEGRKVFANSVKYIKATLASNFGNFFAVAAASLLIPFLPLLPLQILLINLLSDFPMIAIAADTVDPVELRRPQSYNIREIALVATMLGIVSTLFDFMFFALFRHDPTILQTNWFIGSILTELVFLFSIRTHLPFFRARRPAGILLWLTAVAAATTVALPYTALGQSVFHMTPPTSAALGLIASLVMVYFLTTEVVKRMYYRTIRREPHSNSA